MAWAGAPGLRLETILVMKLRTLAAGAMMALASALGLAVLSAPALADAWSRPDVLPPRVTMTEAAISGMTQQVITPVGLRWMSFEPGGTWRTLNENGQPISGKWEIDGGRVCVTGSSWYTKRNCFTYYGSGEIVGGTSDVGGPRRYFPVSLYRTADPADGMGRVMTATERLAGAFPFPARTQKLFFREHELVGWRVEMLTGAGDWYEFRARGQLRHGSGVDRDGERGKWEINEYGDIIVTTGINRSRKEIAFDLLGSKESGVQGMRSYDAPFRYYPVRAVPLAQ